MSPDHAPAGSDPDPEVLAKVAALAAALGDTIAADHSQLRGILNDTMPGHRSQVESTLAFLRAHPDAWKDPPSAPPTSSTGGTKGPPGENSSTRSAVTDHAPGQESSPLSRTSSAGGGAANDAAPRSRAERVPWLHRLRPLRSRRVLLPAAGVVVVAGLVLLVFLVAIPAYQSAKYGSQLEDAFPDITSRDFNCGSVKTNPDSDEYSIRCEMAARPSRGSVTFKVATSQESADAALRQSQHFHENSSSVGVSKDDWAPESVDDEQRSYGTVYSRVRDPYFFADLYYDDTRFSLTLFSPTEEEAEVLFTNLDLLPPSGLPQ